MGTDRCHVFESALSSPATWKVIFFNWPKSYSKKDSLSHCFSMLAGAIAAVHSNGFAPASQVKFKVMFSSECLFGSKMDEMFHFN